MRQDTGDLGTDDPGLRPDMTLEDALASCMQLYQPVPVRDDTGALLGAVYPQDLAKALQVERV
jgi:glycine betaine/proline transport system ATP-binding protein